MTENMIEVAKLILKRSKDQNINLKKLSLLLYYAEAWYMANTDQVLFDEASQAWAYGAMYPSLFLKFRMNSDDIKDRLDLDNISINNKDDVNSCLDIILNQYDKFNDRELIILNQEEDPWSITRGQLEPERRCEEEIDKLLIRNYYAKRIGKDAINRLHS